MIFRSPVTVDDLVAHYGTQRAVAKAVGVGSVNVTHWRKRGIPPKHLAYFLTVLPTAVAKPDAPPSSGDGVPPVVNTPGGGFSESASLPCDHGNTASIPPLSANPDGGRT